MSKAILVMNDPMFCGNCPLAHRWRKDDEYLCGIPHYTDKDCCFERVDMDSKAKPDWCPLKPLPEEDNKDHLLEWSRGYQGGWNDCINAIVGDKHDDI